MRNNKSQGDSHTNNSCNGDRTSRSNRNGHHNRDCTRNGHRNGNSNSKTIKSKSNSAGSGDGDVAVDDDDDDDDDDDVMGMTAANLGNLLQVSKRFCLPRRLFCTLGRRLAHCKRKGQHTSTWAEHNDNSSPKRWDARPEL